jgi:hypothetical protein
MGREACHTLPQILPCEAPSRREAPLPVPKARFTRKNELLSKRTKARFSCHVNPMDQFPSWWHKTVTQRSGHSFEARSSGASSHFVPLHHDPATRSRCRSEETPRPAKRPRRKAGARAKRGVSELCHVNTMDQLPNLEYKPAIQRSDCGFERRKTFAVEMNALARSSDIQRSFLSVSCEHYGSIPTLAAQTCDPAEAVTGLKRGAAEQVRDDFSCEA